MHGIFFGSNDEIEFAHEEGFLYELFRDTGFYKLIDNMQPKPNFVENTQNEIKNVNQNLFESIDNMDESYLDCSNFEDTNYSFAIDKIVNLNTKSNDVICLDFQLIKICLNLNIFYSRQKKSKAYQTLKL